MIVKGKLEIKGNVDQLSSVGTGLILKDTKESFVILVFTLDTVYKQGKESYIIKKIDGFINSIESLFGEMRYLTEEGQNDYNDNLDELYSDTGVQLFNFI